MKQQNVERKAFYKLLCLLGEEVERARRMWFADKSNEVANSLKWLHDRIEAGKLQIVEDATGDASNG